MLIVAKPSRQQVVEDSARVATTAPVAPVAPAATVAPVAPAASVAPVAPMARVAPIFVVNDMSYSGSLPGWLTESSSFKFVAGDKPSVAGMWSEPESTSSGTRGFLLLPGFAAVPLIEQPGASQEVVVLRPIVLKAKPKQGTGGSFSLKVGKQRFQATNGALNLCDVFEDLLSASPPHKTPPQELWLDLLNKDSVVMTSEESWQLKDVLIGSHADGVYPYPPN